MAVLDFNKFQEVSHGTRAEFDIIFVHGLGGNQSRWDCVFETQWISAHVAERFSNARILTFGYSASIMMKGSVEDIASQAQALLDNLELARSQEKVYSTETCRSLLFVAHSVGSIIVKQALSLAKRKQSSSIVERTQGIVRPISSWCLLLALIRKLFLGNFCSSNADREDWNRYLLRFDSNAPTHAISTSQAGAFHHIAMNYHIIRLCEDDVRCTAPCAGCDCTWQRVSEAKTAMGKDHHIRIPSSFTTPQILRHVDRCMSSLVEVAEQVPFYECWKQQKSTRRMIKEATSPGSFNWLLESSQFLTWTKTRPRDYFWIRGAAGAGKSVLVSALVDHLLTEDRNVFYYFHPFHYELDAAVDLLKVLACQLSHASDPALRETSQGILFWRGNDGENPINREEFRSHFNDLLVMIGARKNSVLLIDGLDGFPCAIRDVVLEEIHSLNHLRPPSLKIQCIVTSRQVYPQRAKCTELILEASKGHIREVSNYIARQLGEFNWNSYKEDLSAVHDGLSIRANGCFLWVKLSLQILKASSVKNMIGAIRLLPSSLNEMYRCVLERVPSRHAKTVQTVLSLLMTSRQPLKLEEVSEILEIEPGSNIAEGSTFINQITNKLPEIIGGLVMITRDQTFRLIHSSFKEYLRSLAIGNSENFPLTQAHQRVAQSCMILTKSFMSSSRWQSQSQPHDYDIKHYAIQHWPYHFKKATPSGQPIEGPLQRSLEGICSQWLCEHEETMVKRDRRALAQHLLNFGAFHGINPLVSMSWEMGADIKGGLCPVCPAALVLAVRAGHLATVELLLRKNAGTPTSVLTGPRSPLFYAVTQGMFDIVKLLLAAGASVNTILDESGNTALHLAANASHLTMTRLLIAYGADVTKSNQEYLDSPLHVAAAIGSMGVIKSLLCQFDCYRSPSHLSGTGTNNDDMLQSPGSEMLSGSPYGKVGSACIHSATNSSQRRGEFTTPSRKAVNARNRFGQTPLHIAASNGHHAVLEFLLAQGADAHLVDNDDRTALHFACEQGYPEITGLLAQVMLPPDAHLDFLLILAESNGHAATVAKLSRLMFLRQRRREPEKFSISPKRAANGMTPKVRDQQRALGQCFGSPKTLTRR